MVTVRDAVASDAGAIEEVHEAGWRAGYGHLYEPDVLDKGVANSCTRWSRVFASRDFEETTLLVAERDGVVAGFLHLGPGDEHPPRTWIHSFYVHPSHWGSGAAGALMERAMSVLDEQGVDAVYLTAYDGASRARSFYEKTGFTETGVKTVHDLLGLAQVPETQYSRPVRRAVPGGWR